MVASAPPIQLPAALAQPAVPPVEPGPMPQLISLTLNLNLQENQIKMQKHIFLGQTIQWTFMHFQRVSKSKDFV